jgi:hypothetical protein
VHVIAHQTIPRHLFTSSVTYSCRCE